MLFIVALVKYSPLFLMTLNECWCYAKTCIQIRMSERTGEEKEGE